MSLIPRLFNYHLWEALRPRRFWVHDPFAFTGAEMNALLNQMIKDSRVAAELEKDPFGKDGFQVLIDMQQFKPNEITVKTVDNTVLIEGKHEERQDGRGFISRHFVRKYALPAGYDASKVVSSLSLDGVLTVEAPKPQTASSDNERIVEIQHPGPTDTKKSTPPIDDMK